MKQKCFWGAAQTEERCSASSDSPCVHHGSTHCQFAFPRSRISVMSLEASYITCRRRRWQPSPVFSPGKAHGQRSLAGYRLRGRKESDTTEATKEQYVTHVSRQQQTSKAHATPRESKVTQTASIFWFHFKSPWYNGPDNKLLLGNQIPIISRD